MTKRSEISDEVREDAAVLCAAMADWLELPACLYDPSPCSAWFGTVAKSLSDDAFAAALDACCADLTIVPAVAYREAEALLRDGWCPGDPVYRLKVSP